MLLNLELDSKVRAVLFINYGEEMSIVHSVWPKALSRLASPSPNRINKRSKFGNRLQSHLSELG